ncbi:MAG: cytochrome c oxidase subunit 3 [Polyangia bacterium]
MPKPLLGEQYSDLEQQDGALQFGMWVFLGSELLLFSALFALYASYRSMYPADFEQAIRHNTLVYGTANLYLLLTSSLCAALAVWAMRRGRPRLTLGLLATTIVMGLGFLVIKGAEYLVHIREGALPGRYYHWHELPSFGANRFYSLYWVMTGLHALHVTAGLCVLGWLSLRVMKGAYSVEHHAGLEMGTLYWHLVDIVWIFLWPLLYLS